MNTTAEVVVIGGGVVGVCSAYYLAASGKQVIVVEQGELCSGCSYGNAGLVVPSHSIPLASPGTCAKALNWMLRGQGPFYIRPRLDTNLLRWLLQFWSSATKDRARRGTQLLARLHQISLELYRELAQLPDLQFGFRQNGMLMLFRSKKGLEDELSNMPLLRELGIEAQQLDSAGVVAIEPTALASVAGGLYFPQDAQLLPAQFVHGLAQAAERMGTTFLPNTQVTGFETHRRRITAVRTSRGDLKGECVVLAAGAWSQLVTRHLDIQLPIQAAKGYSVTIAGPERRPQIPVMFGEAKIAIVPMGDRFRFTGVLELAGLDLSIPPRRIDGILARVRDYVDMPVEFDDAEYWTGLRPCSPDGLPIIGRVATIENLIVATGHGMLGISLAPVSGKLVCSLVDNEEPMIDMTMLRTDRF